MENSTTLFEIERFDPKHTSSEDWNYAFEFRREYHDSITPDEPFLPNEAWKKNFLLQLDEGSMDFVIFTAKTAGKLIGICNIAWFTPKSSGYEENKFSAFCGIEILKKYRKQGLGKKLLTKIYPIAKEHNIKILLGGSFEKDGRDFINHIGGQEALANIDNRLILAEVDWDMVNQWAVDGKIKNSTTVLEEYEVVPDHRINTYVKAFDSTLRQVPTGDLDFTMTVNEEEVRKSEA